VGRRLSAKESIRRFDSDPRLHAPVVQLAVPTAYTREALDVGAMHVRIVPGAPSFAPVVQLHRTLGYEPRDSGLKSLRGYQLWARAANRIGHQPPKLARREFESHRAFHAGVVQR
jgi:hypothetical protein